LVVCTVGPLTTTATTAPKTTTTSKSTSLSIDDASSTHAETGTVF